MAQKEGGYVAFVRGIGVTFSALLSIFFFIIALIIFIALLVPSTELKTGNVAVIPITGVISTDGKGDVLEGSGTDSGTVVEWLKKANEDSDTKAIILEIDSPGGSPVATNEIARAVKESNKTVVALIRESGASGAFWIASAADYIIADPLSVTGGIGVTSSHLEFAGLLKRYNITYRRLVAGTYKDAGSRLREMTPEEQALFQRMLNDIHLQFIQEVARNRNLPVDQVAELANGFVLIGTEAKEKGLVDALGTKQDAVKYIEQTLGITAKIYEFKASKTLLEQVTGVMSEGIGRGLAAGLAARAENDAVKITT
jgi:protease-4